VLKIGKLLSKILTVTYHHEEAGKKEKEKIIDASILIIMKLFIA